MQIEMAEDDKLIRPMLHPGGLTREQAVAEVQSILDRLPILAGPAAIWRRGAKDDTVFHYPFVWTILEYEGDDPRRAAMAWLEDFAEIMRRNGANVDVAKVE